MLTRFYDIALALAEHYYTTGRVAATHIFAYIAPHPARQDFWPRHDTPFADILRFSCHFRAILPYEGPALDDMTLINISRMF